MEGKSLRKGLLADAWRIFLRWQHSLLEGHPGIQLHHEENPFTFHLLRTHQSPLCTRDVGCVRLDFQAALSIGWLVLLSLQMCKSNQSKLKSLYGRLEITYQENTTEPTMCQGPKTY